MTCNPHSYLRRTFIWKHNTQDSMQKIFYLGMIDLIALLSLVSIRENVVSATLKIDVGQRVGEDQMSLEGIPKGFHEDDPEEVVEETTNI